MPVIVVEVTCFLFWCWFDEYRNKSEQCTYHYERSADGARNYSQHQQDDCPNQTGYVSGTYDADYPDDYLSQSSDGAAEKAKQRDVT